MHATISRLAGLGIAASVLLLGGCVQPVTSATVYDQMMEGDLPRFESDPYLAEVRTRFDADRTAILADHVTRFSVPAPAECTIPDDAAEALFDLDLVRLGAKQVKMPIEVRIEDFRTAVVKGSCPDGKLAGDVEIRASWTQSFVMPSLDSTTIETWVAIREGTIADGAFKGPLRTTRKKAKGRHVVDLGGGETAELKSPFAISGLSGVQFIVTYSDLESFRPVRLSRPELGFVFDPEERTRVVTVVEQEGDVLRSTSFMGSRKKSISRMRYDGTLHGWQETFGERIGTIDIPPTKTCFVEGEQVKQNACP